MTGEVVSLRLARKAKRRADAEAFAAANRAKHGRTRAERAADAAVEATRRRLLDGARRQDDTG